MSKIDILEHKLVPNHELMTEDEIENELGNADFEIENLPKIKIDDPVVEYMRSNGHNVKEGNILRITRDNSPTAGTFVTYRIVEE